MDFLLSNQVHFDEFHKIIIIVKIKFYRSNPVISKSRNVTLQDLPFENNRFEAAFSMFGLMFLPDRVKGLNRVLKPGKMAAVSS
jgi:hypothetical protein